MNSTSGAIERGIKIIDAHAHIYPDKIAEKASHGIADFYSVGVKYDGTVHCLLERMAAAGVSKCVVHSVATSPEQVGTINSFISRTVSEHPDKLIGFATLYPDADNVEEQVEKAIALGLHGFKLHPDFQRFYADGETAMRTYEIIDGRLPVLIHAGDYRTEFSEPGRILNVVNAFPNLDLIAAHMGGWSEWNESLYALAGSRVYVDTSSCQGFVDPSMMRRLLDAFDGDRIFFGTDYPMWDSSDELDMLGRLLSDSEVEKIYHDNFAALMSKYGQEV